MAIEDELSSEIAIALLAGKAASPELNKLKEVVLKIHASLRKTSNDSHISRASAKAGETNKAEKLLGVD